MRFEADLKLEFRDVLIRPKRDPDPFSLFTFIVTSLLRRRKKINAVRFRHLS